MDAAKVSAVYDLSGGRITVGNELQMVNAVSDSRAMDAGSVHTSVDARNKWYSVDARNDCCSMDAESDCGAMDTGSECSSVGECGLADAGTECGISPSSPASSNCRGVGVGESDRESDILNTSIYHNSNISLVTSLLLIMSFALKHNLTDAALQDLLTLLSYFIPTPNICVTSLHAFKKFFNASQLKSSRIYYCNVCKSSIEDLLTSHCPSCQNILDSKSYLLNICIKEQIQNLFSRPHFFSSIKHRFTRAVSSGYLADVYDGKLYRSLSQAGGFLSTASNISFQWNTDGVPLFSSSSFSMWPLYLKINELPLTMRNCISNKILAGVWFGDSKPSINTFLKPLCETMKTLYSEGVEVQPPELQTSFICRAIILTGTCDVPAKSTALNMVAHNGFFACPYCEQPGKTLSLGNGHVHIYPYISSDPTGLPRTPSRVEECAKESYKSGVRQLGINPPGSCLLMLPHYNIVNGTGIDYMHCILLNIMRTLVSLWFDSTYHSELWSCSKKVTTADSRLTSIRPPSLITRTPRSLTERKYWKASEYRSFLFYYSLPVMLGLLPTEFYEHYSLLCRAVYILNSNTISPHELKRANKLLHCFYYLFGTLYKERYLTLNMHQLLHIADCVKHLGPLHTFSCFDHETCNGTITKMINSNCGVDVQLCYTFSSLQSMCTLAQHKNVQMEYLNDILHSKTSQGTILLSHTGTTCITTELARLFQLHGNAVPECLNRYGRLRMNNIIYHSEVYERPTRINNTVISFNLPTSSGELFGIISFFTSLHNHVFAIVKQLTDVTKLASTENVFVCNKIPGSTVIVPVSHINSPVVFMSFNDVTNNVYIAKFPNTVESD